MEINSVLTGRIGVRVNWRGKLIVQVLRDVPSIPGHSGVCGWEDATVMTLVRSMEIAKEKGVPPFDECGPQLHGEGK